MKGDSEDLGLGAEGMVVVGLRLVLGDGLVMGKIHFSGRIRG